MSKVFVSLQTALVVASLAVVLTACNTVRGIGQDIGAAGGAIEKQARKNKTY